MVFLNECLVSFDEDERLTVLGESNAKVGDKERDRVIEK